MSLSTRLSVRSSTLLRSMVTRAATLSAPIRSTVTVSNAVIPRTLSLTPSSSTVSVSSPSRSFSTTSSSSTFQHLTVTRHAKYPQVLVITMNRPSLHNAFNEELIDEIGAIFSQIKCSDDGDVTATHGDGSAARAAVSELTGPYADVIAVVLTGAGASFSAGADLNWMSKMRHYSFDENLRDSNQLFHMFYSIYTCPVPVIARINGAALGGGVGLVASCDINIAHKDAKFGLTEVKLGLAPAVISSFVMNKISRAAVSQYFLTGQRFDANEGMRIGLISKVAQDEAELDTLVDNTLQEISTASPAAVRATKNLIHKITAEPSITRSKTYCTRLISTLRVSEEGQEGLNAFFEKRKPAWVKSTKKEGQNKK